MLVAVDEVVSKKVLDQLMAQKDFREARFISLSQMKLKEYLPGQ
jgi:hypothetical protein